MKLRLFIFLSCVVLSTCLSMVLQAMQEQQSYSSGLEVALEAMTSPKARNKFFHHIISECVGKQDFKGALDTLRQGLKQGFDVNYEDDENYSSTTLLNDSVAIAPIDFIKALLEAGANPNIRTRDTHVTPLHRVMTGPGNIPLLAELVKAGAEVNVKDSDGYTPLMLAVATRRTRAIALLLKVPDINLMETNVAGTTAFDMAKIFGNQEIINILTSFSITLKKSSLEYIRKNRDKFTQEQIEQLPTDLQEKLQEALY